MSNYRITIPNYRAIENATILNEGLTIIAGENGCGKSTFSRMVYYMVNIMCNFSGYVFRNTLRDVNNTVSRLSDALIQTTNRPEIRVLARNKQKELSSSKDFDQLEVNMMSMLDDYKPVLLKFFDSENDLKRRQRILDFLEVKSNSNSPEELAFACLDSIERSCHSIISKAQQDIDTKNRKVLIDYIKTHGTDLLDFPKDIKFKEDGVDLITSKNFNIPLSLRRAIYIDTPMAVNDNFNFSTTYWDSLSVLLNQDEVDGTIYEKKLLYRLHSILHGDIKVEKDKFTAVSKLRYLREDGLEIDLVNAATGIKSFAYLQKLLANGLLKGDTMLLIDEPEVHLHPQWIVEFARILVLLNKELGVKVMITSHNPDMVAAIQKIAKKEHLLERTHFYLAEKSQANKFQYRYLDLGQNIGPIFESFNIALTRIEEYGDDSSL